MFQSVSRELSLLSSNSESCKRTLRSILKSIHLYLSKIASWMWFLPLLGIFLQIPLAILLKCLQIPKRSIHFFRISKITIFKFEKFNNWDGNHHNHYASQSNCSTIHASGTCWKIWKVLPHCQRSSDLRRFMPCKLKVFRLEVHLGRYDGPWCGSNMHIKSVSQLWYRGRTKSNPQLFWNF